MQCNVVYLDFVGLTTRPHKQKENGGKKLHLRY